MSRKMVLGISAIFGGALLALVLFVGIRMALEKNNAVHYHANFAVYINGKRELFQGPGYYQEVAICSLTNSSDPKARVHMHNNVSDLIHVHDNAVTWSDFFANIGDGLTDHAFDTGDNVYVDGQNGDSLTFILNGQQVPTIADKVIDSEDALLISYGASSPATLQKQYQSITHTAHKYNTQQDPASCSGSKPLTLSERFKRAVLPNQQ